MSELSQAPLATMLLAVLSLCAVVITVTFLSLIRDVRRALRGLNTLLPNTERVVREARRSFHQARSILTRADAAIRHVESAIHETCDVWTGAIAPLLQLKTKAETVLARWFGNGTRVDPRRTRPR